MAANRSTQNGNNQQRSLEARRAERRRRERRRKKRIRALLLLILIIALIVAVILAFASCRKNGNESGGNADAAVEVTAEPTIDPLAPTPAPSDAGLLPPAEEENNLLNIIMDYDEKGAEKTAYLTFDDGPAENTTPVILDTLRRYNIKATFFMLGTSINSYPDLARRVYEEGHLIANHSNGHNYETLYASEESFMNEVQQTEDIITNITNGDHHFKLFRFPGGSYNAGDHAAEKQVYKGTLAANGIYYIDWNALNGDAEGKKKNSQELLEYLQDNLDTDSTAVVLMHDAAAKTATAEGLSSIIEYLMSEGYVFKRLDEMPYLDPSYANPSTAGSDTYSDGSESGYDEDYSDSSSDEDYSSSAYIDESYADEDSDSSSGSDSISSGSSSDSGSSSSGSSSDSNSGRSSGNSDNDDDEDSGSSGLSGNGSIINNQHSGTTTRTTVDGKTTTESETGEEDEN